MESLLLKLDEMNLLASIIGKELKAVQFGIWSTELCFDDFSLFVEPDEINIPTEENHWGHIVTLRIEKMTTNHQHTIGESELKNCGLITNIIRIECLVEIEKPRQVESIEIIPSIIVPAGQGWTNNIYSPTDIAHKGYMNQTLLGLRFETQFQINFTLYSDAVGYFVLYQQGRQLPQIFKDNCEQIKIN